MKRIVFGLTLLTAASLPALAGTDMAPTGKDMKDTKQIVQSQSDAGFYVAAYGGANFQSWYGDNRQTLSAGGSTVSSQNRLSSNWGGVGGIKAGYNFQSWEPGFLGLRLQPAVEAEALYIGDDVRSGAFGGNEKLSLNSGDFFLNGIIRFKNRSIVTPYLGVGLGLQYITTHGDISTPGGRLTGLDTDDVDFAGQALAGFDVQVMQHVSVFTEYKFIDAIGTDGKADSVAGATYRFKPDQAQQNLVTAGVKYTF